MSLLAVRYVEGAKALFNCSKEAFTSPWQHNGPEATDNQWSTYKIPLILSLIKCFTKYINYIRVKLYISWPLEWKILTEMFLKNSL